jgi:hypothetical protein
LRKKSDRGRFILLVERREKGLFPVGYINSDSSVIISDMAGGGIDGQTATGGAPESSESY